MAGSKSDYLENKILDYVLGLVSYSPPATVYVAAYTVAPTDAGGGTEVSGGSYARAAVANNATSWPAASGGSKNNGINILFATATAAWGDIDAFGIFDAVSGGNLLYWGDLTATVTIGLGDTLQFPITTGMTVTED